MIASDDEMCAAEILPDDGVPQGFPRPSHPHRQGEQAHHRGDFAWDAAEFLYYSGHYWLSYSKAVSDYVNAFVEGYLEKGDAAVLKSAASPKYVRVFSIWTPPNILHNMRKRLLRPN